MNGFERGTLAEATPSGALPASLPRDNSGALAGRNALEPGRWAQLRSPAPSTRVREPPGRRPLVGFRVGPGRGAGR